MKGKAEGNGKLNYEEGQYYYIGQFKDDLRHGKGIIYDKKEMFYMKDISLRIKLKEKEKLF